MESDTHNDWTTISIKKHKNKKSDNQIIDIKLDKIIKIICNVLLKYTPYAIYIYGSRARKTNRLNSDIDLMVFWKKSIPDDDYLKDIKQELIDNIKINVDMINMFIINKNNKVYNTKDKYYYDNVIIDAICAYETTKNNISDLIDMSIKLDIVL